MYEMQILITLISLIGLGVAIVGFPGIFLVLLGLVLYGLFEEGVIVPNFVYITFAVVTVISLFIDNLAILLGAKKYGATSRGIGAAIIGGLIGFILFFPIGAIIGAFLGVFISELLDKKDLDKALKASLGTIIGYISGIALKFLITLGLFVWLMFIIW
ncbi:MAG: uncharacterized protein QG570_575 [Patescibacteria group bacterium]|nr:uncharacterized protein [Patescibacteria group bacterium]